MKKRLLKENYYPVITSEIRHNFLLVWMGDIGREVLSGTAGNSDFHFEGKEMEDILKFFDEKSIGIMGAGYPVVSKAIPDRYIRIAEGKMIKKSQLKTLIKEIVESLQLEYDGGLNKEVYRQMTPAQQEVVRFLLQRSFSFSRADKTTGQLVVILERPWGKGRHGGNRFAAVRPDGTINRGLSVRDFLNVVGESMTTRAELNPGTMKAANVAEYANEDIDLKKAKELADTIWGDKVKMVYPYPAKSDTEYFRVDLRNAGVEWLAKTQISGWIYSKNNKMIPVNDTSVNEKTNPDGTYTDDMESGMKAKAYSGLKENEFDGYKAPKHDATVTADEMKEAQDIASKIFGGVYITRFHSKGLKGWPIYFEVSLHGPNGEKRWICKGKDGKWLVSSGKGKSSRWESADKHIVKEGGRWSMGEYTPEQEQSIYLLQRQGFREVSSFPNEPDAEGEGQDGRVTVVLQKKRGLVRTSVEVDADGMCNGQSIQDYLRSGIDEQTSSGAAGGQAGGTISVPAWGTKNKMGSPRAIKAAKKYGTVVKSISEKAQ